MTATIWTSAIGCTAVYHGSITDVHGPARVVAMRADGRWDLALADGQRLEGVRRDSFRFVDAAEYDEAVAAARRESREAIAALLATLDVA